MISTLSRGVLAASLAAAAACRAGQGPSPDRVWALMRERLAIHPAVMGTHNPQPTFDLREVRDSRLPGTRFFWGIYLSRTTSHVRVTIVAAQQHGRVAFVDGSADWSRLYAAARAFPATAGEAIGLCSELIATTRPGRSPYGTVRLIVSPDSVNGPGIVDPDRVRGFAKGPAAARDGDVWTVSLSTLERGRTMTYRCMLPRGGGSSYTHVDSIMDAGFVP
jgi:hypothetical protein